MATPQFRYAMLHAMAETGASISGSPWGAPVAATANAQPIASRAAAAMPPSVRAATTTAPPDAATKATAFAQFGSIRPPTTAPTANAAPAAMDDAAPTETALAAAAVVRSFELAVARPTVRRDSPLRADAPSPPTLAADDRTRSASRRTAALKASSA
eukprot:13281073-Alexandrium_andersonii.AAC.1